MQENKKQIADNFNPIKQEEDGKRARRVIWTTEALNKALAGLNDGRKLVANPFYENNYKLLKGDLVFRRTDEEIAEWKHCANDIIYFANKYAKLMTPEGIQHVKLRDYQERYLKHLVDHRLSIFLSCRQSGKTTTSAIFMLHYILFNVDKNALVLGNKRRTAVEILDKAKKIFYELPYFLRPGIYKWNESEIALDNGCRLMAEATTINSGISFTFHCVLADEFAHVPPNILDRFYNNLFPVITAGKARFMITSTQNGYNLFYRLYKSAEAGENEYAAFKTDWYEVPEWNPDKRCWEKRDEAWHKLQVANYGSEEAFNKQFGTNFDVSSNTLIDNKFLSKCEQQGALFTRQEMPGVNKAWAFYWMPGYNLEEMHNEWFVITTDIAEGVGGDDTVYTFNRLELNGDRVHTRCVGFFKDNHVNAEEATTILQQFCTRYLDPNKYLISLEYNFFGELFAKYIMKNIEDDPSTMDRFSDDVIIKYWNEDMTRYTLGKKITAKSKATGVALFKQAFERYEIINESLQFINQLSNFSDTKGNGTYAACFGHDDLVMSQLQMVYVTDNPQYKFMCEMFIYSQMNGNPVSNGFNPYSFDGQQDAYGGYGDEGAWGSYNAYTPTATAFDSSSDALSRLNGHFGNG